MLPWHTNVFSADFLAIRVEAENFSSKSDQWVLTSPDNIPDIQPDPDPAHNATASGNANLELLPDTRATHDDEIISSGPGVNFWGEPGFGPRIDFDIFIPEPGRYVVYVKTFSTGTEDNGLHVGINGTLPESGKRIQSCEKNNWIWTSKQRTAEFHCGVDKGIFLDVQSAGVNTVTFFAREDGFEVDQILLLKETHDGSLDCFPIFNDKVRCRNKFNGQTLSDTDVAISQTSNGDNQQIVSITPPSVSNEEIDLDINIDATGSMHHVADMIEFKIIVANKAIQNTATNAVATATLPEGLSFIGSADCSSSGITITCDLGNISAESEKTASFFVTAVDEGVQRVDSQVIADQTDSVSNNDIDSESITTAFNIPDYEAGVSLTQSSNVSAVGDLNRYVVTVTNNGTQLINTATLLINTGNEFNMEVANCPNNCIVSNVASGESVAVEFSTVSTLAGVSSLQVQLDLANDSFNDNNTASIGYTVIDAATAVGVDGVVTIDAEAFTNRLHASSSDTPDWFLVNEDFVPLEESLDPDLASYQNANGNAYMELLPDRRIDDSSAEIAGVSNILTGGVGAALHYNVFFPEAGAYQVFARIRANNSQDASLHLGLDNVWPAENASLSVCNPDGSWQWTNSLGQPNDCSQTVAAQLQVATPGFHVVMVSQNTDGLELDRLVLSKDPVIVSELDTLNPKTIDLTNDIDLAVETTLSKQSVSAGEAVDFVVSINNNSSTQEALGVIVAFEGVTPQELQNNIFDTCSATVTGAVCYLVQLGAQQSISERFSISVNDPSVVGIVTTINSALLDSNSVNNTDNKILTVTEPTSGGGGSLSVDLSLVMLLSLLFLTITSRQQVARKVRTCRIKK